MPDGWMGPGRVSDRSHTDSEGKGSDREGESFDSANDVLLGRLRPLWCMNGLGYILS